MKELKNWFENYLHGLGMPDSIVTLLSFILFLAISAVLIYLSIEITKWLLKKIVGPVIQRTTNKWDDLLVKHKLFRAIGFLVSGIAFKLAVPFLFDEFPKTLEFMNRLVEIYFIFIIIKLVIVILRASEDHLADSRLFVEKPLASYFQLFRIVLYIIGFILALSILLSKSPVYLLGAFGAMTAVLLLIFKDTILGLVASIQISANDMVRVGDWIEMPKFNADGDVIAINLNTIKVSNWDKTITTVPTYYLITESFKNWRGMQTSGGRRIKRNLNINVNSIRLVTPEMREKFKKIALIRDYIIERQSEIEAYNAEFEGDTDILVNGRRMTNIGVFRIYIDRYLRSHPGINQDMSLMVRQQPPDATGLPLQIYCFTKSVKWVEHEEVQSDIFDHLFAVASYFEISVFQSPAGEDFRNAFERGGR